jgi:hypothetical protein
MARSFNGTSDKITSPACILYSNNGGWSYSVWLNVTAVPAAYAGLFIKNASPSIYVRVNGAQYQFAVYWNSFSLDPVPPLQSINTWVHFAFVQPAGASSTATAYINGVSAGTHAAGSSGADASNAVTTGDDPPNTPRFLNARIADEAFWNLELTAGEIGALARGARPGNIRPTSLKLWWPLDGLQSPEPDLSGNKNNATLTGTTLAAGPPIKLLSPKPNFTAPIVVSGRPDLAFFTTPPIKRGSQWSDLPLAFVQTAVTGLNADRFFQPTSKSKVVPSWDSTLVPAPKVSGLNADRFFDPSLKNGSRQQFDPVPSAVPQPIILSNSLTNLFDPGTKRRIDDKWETPRQFVPILVTGSSADTFFNLTTLKIVQRTNFRWDVLPFVVPTTTSEDIELDRSFDPPATLKQKIPSVWYWYPSTSFTVAPLLVFRQEQFNDTTRIVNNKIRSTYEWTWWSFPFPNINYLHITGTDILELPIDSILIGQQDYEQGDSVILAGQQHYKVKIAQKWEDLPSFVTKPPKRPQ